MSSPQLPQRQDALQGLGDGLVEPGDGAPDRRAGEGDDLARDLAAGDLAAAWALGARVGAALVSGGERK